MKSFLKAHKHRIIEHVLIGSIWMMFFLALMDKGII